MAGDEGNISFLQLFSYVTYILNIWDYLRNKNVKTETIKLKENIDKKVSSESI